MSNTMNLASCIQHLFPNLSQAEWRVSKVAGEQVITLWPEGLAKPTTQEIAAAQIQVDAKLAAKVAGKTLLASLKSAYDNFSDGGKAAFGVTYDAVVAHVRRGDIAAAKIAVQMVVIPAEVPGVAAKELATWSAKKTEILALFP